MHFGHVFFGVRAAFWYRASTCVRSGRVIMNTISHRCPRYSVRSVHSRPLLENFLDILAARQHLAVAYSKDRSRYRARLIPKSRCRSQNGSLRCLSLEELQDRAAAHARLLVSQCALDTSFVRRMHAHVGYACVTEPEQRSALNRCTCLSKARKPRRLGTGRQARRAAAGGSAKRTFRFQRPQTRRREVRPA